jgi:hypothetical protein
MLTLHQPDAPAPQSRISCYVIDLPDVGPYLVRFCQRSEWELLTDEERADMQISHVFEIGERLASFERLGRNAARPAHRRAGQRA